MWCVCMLCLGMQSQLGHFKVIPGEIKDEITLFCIDRFKGGGDPATLFLTRILKKCFISMLY